MPNGPLEARVQGAPARVTPEAPSIREGGSGLEEAIRSARDALLKLQSEDGYWVFELEADCTIPAEYVLMMHFLDEVDEILEARLAVYLRGHQLDEGGWSLYYGGDPDLSCSVKAYYALKLHGDDPGAPHMRRAREWILAEGGAARANVFTRITLALFGQVPWRAVPFIPVEIVLLPRWFPFHLSKVSYWSRTVMVPLFVLTTLKPAAENPERVEIRELFAVPPEEESDYFPVWSPLNHFFVLLDALGRLLEPFVPAWVRARAMRRAEEWILERLNGRGGLGAIFPAMVNAVEALTVLGYAPDEPRLRTAKEALRLLLVERGPSAYCQPCVSPVWDTALACLALQETGDPEAEEPVDRALEWLRESQLRDELGDWRDTRPELPGGGWPFQFRNDHYPDLDDTAVVAWVMHHTGDEKYRETVHRAARWLAGMQSRNGGFASFDVDNTHEYLNEIPFADHGALLDPPTSDVTARCVRILAELAPGRPELREPLDRALAFLLEEQEDDGAWFGRWGTNYVYGTWSVLAALERVGLTPDHPAVRGGAEWLKSVQRADGGWGEDQWSYHDPATRGRAEESTSFQTAWALLGLMSAGEADSPEVGLGVRYLLRTQQEDGLWSEPWFTAPGFPRVFYLKYHGYSAYFPLMALARYRATSTS